MSRPARIQIHPCRPNSHPYHDWGIGRKPSTPKPAYCRDHTEWNSRGWSHAPPLHEPDYAKLRQIDLSVTDPVPSYANYIRSK